MTRKRKGPIGTIRVEVRIEYVGNAKVWIRETAQPAAALGESGQRMMDKIEEAIAKFIRVTEQEPVDK